MSFDRGKKVLQSSKDSGALLVWALTTILETTYNALDMLSSLNGKVEAEFDIPGFTALTESLSAEVRSQQPPLITWVGESGGAAVRETECRSLLPMPPSEVDGMKVANEAERALEELRRFLNKSFLDASAHGYVPPSISEELKKMAAVYLD